MIVFLFAEAAVVARARMFPETACRKGFSDGGRTSQQFWEERNKDTYGFS